MKDYPTFEDAIRGDQMIYQLATYDVTNGMILAPSSMEEVTEIQRKIAKRFNHFKKLIQTKEMTYEELSGMVSLKNGPFHDEDRKLTEEQAIDKLIAESQAPIINEDQCLNMLSKIFGDIMNTAGADKAGIRFIPIDPYYQKLLTGDSGKKQKPEKPEKPEKPDEKSSQGNLDEKNEKNTKKDKRKPSKKSRDKKTEL